MNYEEIRKRLNKCQVTLQLLQTKEQPTKSKVAPKDVTKAIKVLKESIKKYKKILKEEESYLLTPKGGKPTLAKLSDDEVTALKSSDDVDKIKTAAGEEVKENSLFKKNNGVEFDQNETKKIAKEVGKSLAIALKKAGDELESMKAHHIEPNSFDIHVEYKKEGNSDEFSFYVIDDSLHLVDFSFDKELVEVGVKPSGEAIINRDVLANELLKHFKSLNEDLNEVNYDYYTTPKHFDICPGAEALRDEVLASGKTPEELGEWTFKHDELFKLEKAVLKANKADERHVKVAKDLAGEITHHSRDLGIEANKIGYLKGHIKKIEDVANKTDGRGDNMSLRSRDIYEGEGDDHHYLKVSRRDYKKAQAILDQNIDPTYVKVEIVDNDGAGNVIFYFIFRHEYGFDDMYDDPEGKENPEFYQEPDEDPQAFVYDVVMDLRANDITVTDSSADMDENVTEDEGDYIAGYDDGEGPAVDDEGDMDEDYDPDQEQKNDEEDHGVAYDDDGRPLGEDLDIGHQDDEPSMLKSSAFETATYAAKLAKKLAQYDQVDGEVDFPNWWQKKLILARDYMSAAYHYLDSEEKQPLIDKLALEHVMNEGTELYDRNGINIKRFSGGKRGLMVQITYGGDYIHVPAEEFATLARAMQSVQGDLKDMSTQIPRRKNIDEIKAAKIQKAHGQVVAKMKELAKQYKAGDKSVVPQLKDLTAKKKQLEKHLDQAVAGTHHSQELSELSADQRNELVELQNILDDAARLGDEAREIIRQSFPRMLSKGDAYGAFEFGTSANRYDTTLGSIIEEIEEYYDEEEDDMDEGNLKEEMDGGRLFDYFANKGYKVTERRPDGVPFGVQDLSIQGYMVSRGSARSPQAVIFQYNKDKDQFTISRMSGYRIDQKDAIKAGMRKAGRSSVAGMDSYMTDGNYTPVDISAEGLKDIVDHVMSGLDREGEAQSDFYKGRGRTSGTVDEATRKDLGIGSSVSKRRAKAELRNPGNDGSKVYGLDKEGKRVHIKNINDVDKFNKFELDADISEAKGGQIFPGDYVKTQYGDIYKRVDGKVGKHDAYVRVIGGKVHKRKTALHHSVKLTVLDKEELKEGASCCGKCGRVHVKGNCKRPYLKGKSHCRNK